MTTPPSPGSGSPAAPHRSRRLLRCALVATSVAVAVLLGEAGARLAGWRPFRVGPLMIRAVEPKDFFAPDSELGYVPGPGQFTVTYASGYRYRTTHDARGRRVTAPEPGGPGRPEVHVLGDSFTYGWSVEDEATWPWRLQEAMPGVRVVNHAVAGYGTVHHLIQLRRLLERDRPPSLVLLTWSSLFEERNVLTRRFRKAIVAYGDQVEAFGYPHVSGLEPLSIRSAPLAYRPPGLVRVSALAHCLETEWSRLESGSGWPRQASRRLLAECVETCRRRGVPVVVVGIYDDAPTRETLAWCASALDVPVVDVSVDLSRAEFNLLPVDWHPSPLAHAAYSDGVHAFLLNHRPALAPTEDAGAAPR